MNKFQEFKAFLTYREAVKKANRAHAKTGDRFYVMPNRDTTIMLLVTDRKNFRGIRMKGYLDPTVTWDNAKQKCFYYTPYKDGSGLITDEELMVKQIAYQSWYQDRIKAIPAERKKLRDQRKLERKAKRQLNRK